VIVLDTSAFIAGFDPLAVPKLQFTVPEVRNELIAGSMPWMRFNAAVESGKVTVTRPTNEALHKVRETSRKAGDIRCLSEADIQVLALASELKNKGLAPVIVTDDYSMQNVANKLKMKFTPLMTFGIKYRFRWILYCPACYRKYPQNYKAKICEICGTALKRKPTKKTGI